MLNLAFTSNRGKFALTVNAQLSTNCATAILGHNGSGKTSLLRAIAGLDRAAGKIYLNDVKWLDTEARISVPTHARNVGFISQRPQLFPHMTVSQNLRFALRLANKRGRKNSTEALSEITERFELSPLLARKPATLSGGETSRVVLARALLSNPGLLLFDEPLATIDVDRKSELLPYLEKLLIDRPMPMLYVTHDYTEIARLCEHTLVLRDGNVVAVGRTSDVTTSLSAIDLPSQEERSSIVNARYVNFDDNFFLAYFNIGEQLLVIPLSKPPNFTGLVPIRIRDRDVAIASTQPRNLSIRNVLKCQIEGLETLKDSPFVQVQLRCDTQAFSARITCASTKELGLEQDMEVFALIKSATLEV